MPQDQRNTPEEGYTESALAEAVASEFFQPDGLEIRAENIHDFIAEKGEGVTCLNLSASALHGADIDTEVLEILLEEHGVPGIERIDLSGSRIDIEGVQTIISALEGYKTKYPDHPLEEVCLDGNEGVLDYCEDGDIDIDGITVRFGAMLEPVEALLGPVEALALDGEPSPRTQSILRGRLSREGDASHNPSPSLDGARGSRSVGLSWNRVSGPSYGVRTQARSLPYGGGYTPMPYDESNLKGR